MPAAQDVTVSLTQNQTDYIWNFVQIEFPSMTGPQVMAKLEEAALQGIRNYVSEVVTNHFRDIHVTNNDNTATERGLLDTAFETP